MVETPSVNVIGGTFSSTQMVSLSTATPGADIYYTFNGNIPFLQENKPYKYEPSEPLRISSDTTLTAVARKAGMSDSSSMVQSYVMQGMQQVSAPTSNLNFFEISNTPQMTATLACATAGAAIYYTTDGSRPTIYSNLYSGAFDISGVGGVMAVATKDDWIDSNFFMNAYQLGSPVAQTFFSPGVYVNNGEPIPPLEYYDAPLNVTLSNATVGVTIYYTTDGSLPNTNSSVYTGPFSISPAPGENKVSVYTLAMKTGMLKSEDHYTYNFRDSSADAIAPAAPSGLDVL